MNTSVITNNKEQIKQGSEDISILEPVCKIFLAILGKNIAHMYPHFSENLCDTGSNKDTVETHSVCVCVSVCPQCAVAIGSRPVRVRTL